MADQAFPDQEAYPSYIQNMRRSDNVEHAGTWAAWHAQTFGDETRIVGGYSDKLSARASQLAKDAGLNDIGSNK